jgi:DNA mismatch endonuclease (patch repair protein)
MDTFDREKRSEIMKKISGKNTYPEMVVRKMLHRMGYRYRLHRTDLPGKPDIVLPKYKKIILIHGCFWHGHEGCKRSKLPDTNRDFWRKKISKNMERDRYVIEELKRLGWSVLTIWNCEIRNKNLKKLEEKLEGFIKGS